MRGADGIKARTGQPAFRTANRQPSLPSRGKAPRRALAALVTAGCVLACTACAPSVSAPSPHWHLDPFYTKSIDAHGIPITSSPAVPDRALRRARSLVDAMLARRPDLRQALIRRGQRVMVTGIDEQTMDVPEQRDWKKPTSADPALTVCERKHYDEWIGRKSDRDYWNTRARGMGGILTSAATENLLAIPGTKYYGETILVHEFAHAILDAVEIADPPLFQRVQHAYADAIRHGLWKGEYGETTAQEYWAEGTQFWFNSNKLAMIDGRRVLSDRDLAAYDPALASLLREVYGDRHHLPGDPFYNHPARAPQGLLPISTAPAC